MDEIETLESSVVYQNRWMTVREDKIRRASGAEGIFGVIDKPDFVLILPVEGDHVYLVEQYRYAVRQRYWELPQGSWEDDPDVDPLKLAAGELAEEVGLLASSLVHVGTQYLAYGYSNQAYHICLASGFSSVEKKLDAEEEGLISKRFSLTEFEAMILDGRIRDASTVNAYGLAKLKGML